MRRSSFIAMAIAALALAVPGAALAHGRSHHPKRHSHRVTHSHRVRSHIKRFVATNQTAPPTTTTPSDNAGTVASFTNGVLTITLADGSSVSGNVTQATEIECRSATMVTEDARTRSADNGPGGATGGGDQGGENDGGNGDNGGGNGANGGGNGANGGGDQGDDNGADGNGADGNGGNGATCDSTALVAGAVVHEADLRIDSSGSAFSKLELVS